MATKETNKNKNAYYLKNNRSSVSLEFIDDEAIYTEKGTKVTYFFGSILLVILGFGLLFLNALTESGSKADNYTTAGGFMSILFGLGLFVYSFIYKEKIYYFTPTILQVVEKKSETIIDEIDTSEVTHVNKELVLQQQEANSEPNLNAINYTIFSKVGNITFTFSTKNKLQTSISLDKFITSNYNVKLLESQKLITPKK